MVGSPLVASDSGIPRGVPAMTLSDKAHTMGFGTGDKMETSMATPETCSDKSGNSSSQGIVSSDAPSSPRLISDIGDAPQPINMEKLDRSSSGDGCDSESLNILLILRKVLYILYFWTASVCLSFI